MGEKEGPKPREGAGGRAEKGPGKRAGHRGEERQTRGQAAGG